MGTLLDRRFWNEWNRRANLPARWGKLTTMWKSISAVLAVAGVSLTAFGPLQSEVAVHWWIIPIAIALALFLGITFGGAWEMAQQPIVEVGPLEIDLEAKVFFVWVKNGPVPVNFSIRIIGATERSWE